MAGGGPVVRLSKELYPAHTSATASDEHSKPTQRSPLPLLNMLYPAHTSPQSLMSAVMLCNVGLGLKLRGLFRIENREQSKEQNGQRMRKKVERTLGVCGR